MALRRRLGLPDGGGAGVDRISGLPEELLLQVLVRLRCAREAARTAVLARRWRELPVRLPEYSFSGVDPEAVEAALGRVTRPTLDLLHIKPDLGSEAALGRAPSLLRAAARRKPEIFIGDLVPSLDGAEATEIELPCFDRARFLILVSTLRLSFTPPAAGAAAFTRLESLEFSSCHAIPDALLPSCPCLRVLRVCAFGARVVVPVRSATLEQLAVRTMDDHDWVSISRVDVEAPLLKKAKLDIAAARKFSMSFLAPAVENLDWEIRSDLNAGLPDLRLSCVEYTLRLGIRTLLLRIDGLTIPLVLKRSFPQEIARLQVAEFSVLNLVVESKGHAFGPLLLHLLQIRPVIRKLQLQLNQGELDDGVELCQQNCSCRQPTNWKNGNISLPNLEELIICYGFEIGDQEVDFLKLLLRCAPMLKSLKVRVPGEGIKNIHKVCEEYPHVECDASQ